jgi:hypothetical protein
MRLWSLHPQHLDAKGLVALWREALLAQKVLLGATKGYRNHPQLQRFKSHRDPLAAIAAYLHGVAREADRRGYHFDTSKILCADSRLRIRVTDGQVAFELAHLRKKLKARDPVACARLVQFGSPSIHPLFKLVHGGVEDWEVV